MDFCERDENNYFGFKDFFLKDFYDASKSE